MRLGSCADSDPVMPKLAGTGHVAYVRLFCGNGRDKTLSGGCVEQSGKSQLVDADGRVCSLGGGPGLARPSTGDRSVARFVDARTKSGHKRFEKAVTPQNTPV